MAWLEIIEIRAIGSNRELIESQLKEFINSVNQETNLITFKVYHNLNVKTDFSIHFFHDSEKADACCSPLCLRLASSLKDIGLVNQSVWIENFKLGEDNDSKK